MKLAVGDKIRIGREYANKHDGFKPNEVIELIEGQFEEYNGLYNYTSKAPSIWSSEREEFDSIYHLFGNDLEDFMDCELLKPLEQ